MKTKIITSFFIICLFFINGCTQSTWLYRVPIQQGNLVSAEQVQKLHLRMTKEAVCELLGAPVLMDPFNDNRWTYTFTFKSPRGAYLERTLTVYFKNNCICGINKRNIT